MPLRCLPLQWNRLAFSQVLRSRQRVDCLPRRPLAIMASAKSQLLSVAPMMDWTDVHYRQLARMLSRHTWLYTEMVVDSTLIHNPDRDRFLLFPPEQHPIVCQLGGSDPAKLAAAAKIVAEFEYDEINLNCGCPSDRVAGAGCFGAALMLEPQLVANCCKAVSEAVASHTSPNGGPPPITVKCRLGVDDCDSYEELCGFVKTVSEGSPVTHFIIHARKCHLKGLNPHQNRTVPPLRYEWVWALKRDFPHLEFSLNGGVLTLQEAATALRLTNPAAVLASLATNGCSNGQPMASEEAAAALAAAAAPGDAEGGITGVMIGRAAYHTPWHTLSDADRAIFGEDSNPAASRRQVLEQYAKYADNLIASSWDREDGRRGPSVRVLFKPLMGMFHNEPRGKKWRAAVDTSLKTATTVSQVLEDTLHILTPETLDAPPPRAVGMGDLLHFAPELPPQFDSACPPNGKRVKTS